MASSRPDQVSPSTLPVLPLRGAVHFPGMLNTVQVARESSLRSLREAFAGDRLLLAVSDDGCAETLRLVGTVCEVLQATVLPDGSMRAVLRGLYRARMSSSQQQEGGIFATHERIPEPTARSRPLALVRECHEGYTRIASRSRTVPTESIESVMCLDAPGPLADAIAHHLPLPIDEKQGLLEVLDPVSRLRRVHLLIRKEEKLLDQQSSLRDAADLRIGESQRQLFLREQLRAIQTELFGDGHPSVADALRERLEASKAPDAVAHFLEREIANLERLPEDSSESMVVRRHIETVLAIPWNVSSTERLDLEVASLELDAQHFGLDKVKERVLEFLAVRKLSGGSRSPILCFEGPPGVGKTSLGRAIARALGREFAFLSLGGVRDEAEIRGHRRSYVGAQPGRLVQTLIGCGKNNPVLMLDEVDKMASDGFHGDPAAALLEALDPGQNSHFRDHFVDVPCDLSQVLFIATANSVASLPPALIDRLEIIQFSSYGETERVAIARRYLIPQLVVDHGLSPDQLVISDEALLEIVRSYAHEPGVRELDRQISTICRKSALRVARGEMDRLHVTADELPRWLGAPPPSRQGRRPEVGTANGLVVAAYGGDVMSIEVALMEPSGTRAAMTLTGSLGDVMKESAETALSFLRSSTDLFANGAMRKDFHLHMPQGDKSKEGPSAGLAIALAMASAMTSIPISNDLAITGEITLHGNVLPVGGIREKVLAAHRLGIKHVILPLDNAPELAELPPDVRDSLTFLPVEHANEALRLAELIPNRAALQAG